MPVTCLLGVGCYEQSQKDAIEQLQMITYQKGNLLDARVDALVNTVNEVGVMGQGHWRPRAEARAPGTDAHSTTTRGDRRRQQDD